MSETFLAGKVAVVTGGAVGIGRACVEALAGGGASVVTCDVRPLVEEVAANATARGGGEVTGVIADISEPEDVYATVDLATEQFGGVDILVNNAAVWADHTVRDPRAKALQEYEAIMGTNLRGSFLFGRAVMPGMIERGGGDIVNMSTYYVVPPRPLMPRTAEELAIVGERPPFTDLYSASKFALTGLTQAWAGALREHGVRVNAICMGETDTPMLRAYWQGRPFPYRVETWIRPQQIAGLVLDLLREGPEGRTGANIGAWVGVPVELPPRDGD